MCTVKRCTKPVRWCNHFPVQTQHLPVCWCSFCPCTHLCLIICDVRWHVCFWGDVMKSNIILMKYMCFESVSNVSSLIKSVSPLILGWCSVSPCMNNLVFWHCMCCCMCWRWHILKHHVVKFSTTCLLYACRHVLRRMCLFSFILDWCSRYPCTLLCVVTHGAASDYAIVSLTLK